MKPGFSIVQREDNREGGIDRGRLALLGRVEIGTDISTEKGYTLTRMASS